jgi:hypothetical protein
MMRFFMEEFGGRDEHWAMRSEGIDLAALRQAMRDASGRGQGVLLLGASFALAAMLDELRGEKLHCPPGSLVMQTGGFKGKARTVEPEVLRQALAESLGLPPEAIIGEYGMTELTGQLYEGTAPGASIAGPRGLYLEPPWVRVSAVDPATLLPVPAGQPGLARIVDLGNVDSAVAILTADLVVREGAGVRLVGRQKGAIQRGCSLPYERLSSGAFPGNGGEG